MSRYDELSREELVQRLDTAERVCVLFGWTAVDYRTDIGKATGEAWSQWADIVGSDFTGPRAHPELSDAAIAALARQRDATRARTLAKIPASPYTEEKQ